jgi:uncharacterized protein (TIGR00369 family)
MDDQTSTAEELFRKTWLRMPFNIFLGLEFVSLKEDGILLRFKMREDFVGNYIRGPSLHGGVIASIMDIAGGVAASFKVLNTKADTTMEKLEDLFSRSGTIDLRVDYLRPGKGEEFLASAAIMRLGRRVAVTRMELRNDQDTLVAVGTGTYIMG